MIGKNKICHFTTVHSIDDVRIFKKECTSLAANGFDVTLIACGNESYTDILNGVKRISLNVPVKNRLQRFFKRSKEVYKKAIEVNADIYHFHDPELLPVGLKLKRKGKKVIFDSHEFYGEQLKGKKYLPIFLRNLIAKVYKHYEKFVCIRIDAVIQVCTLSGKNYFENRAQKTEFITNTPIFQDIVNFTTDKFESRNSIVHVGTLSYNRGTTHIIKAAKIAKTKLILGGNFNSKKYQTELIELEEFSNVDFRGFINKDEMNSIFNQSFAGLSTLLHINQYHKIDTLPTKVFDYMAAGLPVILSNTKYAVDIIKKYQFGLVVNPENNEEIANAITYLKHNKAIAKQMGDNGRKAFEEKFNWEIEEKKMLDLYYYIIKTDSRN